MSIFRKELNIYSRLMCLLKANLNIQLVSLYREVTYAICSCINKIGIESVVHVCLHREKTGI